MRGWTGAAAALFLLLLTAAPVSALQPVEGPLRVFLVCDAGSASVGDTVNFTVYTFLDGEPATLPEPPSVTFSTGSGTVERQIPVQAAAPGIYEGSLVVLAADTDTSYQATLLAKASYETPVVGRPASVDSDSAILYIYTASAPPAPEVQFSGYLAAASETPIRPGTMLTFMCCATLDGVPFDPPELSFTMAWNGVGLNPVVHYQRMGTGSYRLKFTVPKIHGNDQISLYYHYNQTNGYSYGGPVGPNFRVDFFNVLYHELKRSGTCVDFELLVSDWSGAPAPGTTVSISAQPDSGSPGVGLTLGKTDGNGKVKGFFDFGPSTRYASISGWANDSHHSQSFGGFLYLSDQPRNYDHGDGSFYLEPLGLPDYFTPGTQAEVSFRAHDLGEPVRNSTVECYVKLSSHDLEGNSNNSFTGSRIPTDADGVFHANVSFPPVYWSSAEFIVVGPREVSSQDEPANWDYYYVDAYNSSSPAASPGAVAWNASLSKAAPGGSSRVAVNATPGDALSGMAQWDIASNVSDRHPAWAVWSTFSWPLTGGKSGLLGGKMVLPRQLRSGTNLTVNVDVQNATGAQTSRSFTMKVTAATTTETAPDLCCITSIFVVNIGLIGLLFFNYLAARRKPAHRDLEELEPDERIEELLRVSGGGQPGLTLPIKVEMAQAEDCTVCGRRIARGNLALRCVCGGRFHEHCTGDGTKCPSCGREWKKS